MYHRYFGMKHRPFTATPHTSFCYPAPNQEEALATLHYAITQGRGIAVLTGLPGTGKTLVCHRLTTGLEPAFTTAMITNTHMPTVKGLLQAILYDLSLPFQGLDEQELRLTLTDFLLGKFAGGGRMVLVIDEAQNLGIPLLEELRMFSNLEGDSDKLFQIVLAGHPRLLQLLRDPELETLTQRIGARAVLAPLSDEDTIAYIQHQVECAGVRWDEVISYDALRAIYDASAGIPRLINQLCDHAFLRAYVTEVHRVDATIVARAKADLEQPADRAATASTTQPSVISDTATQPNMEPVRAVVEQMTVHETAESFVACTECEGSLETMEVNTYQLVEDADPLLAMALESPCKQTVAGPQRAESFVEEEIVVDPYAMMDAQRTAASARRLPAIAETPSRAATPDYHAAPDTNVPHTSPTAEPSLSDVRFLEPTDNPAVHEVGAGTTDLAQDGSEPPILVIEQREQRIGNHIARVDSPQQAGREARGYRRLFTHARKS